MSNEPRRPEKKPKDKNMNVKLPEDDYHMLQQIADKIGGMTLSSMIRMLIYERLNKVKKSGDPGDFLGFKNK